jgi:hypothetical protein
LAKAGVERGTEVTVTLRNRSVVTGRIDSIGKQSLVVVDPTGGVTQVPYRNVVQMQACSPGYTTRIVLAAAAVAAVCLVLIISQWANAN